MIILLTIVFQEVASGDIPYSELRMSEKAELAAVRAYFGVPWPQRNEGLSYHDIVRPTDAGLCLHK